MGTPRPFTAEALVPSEPTLDALRGAAAACTACPLFQDATQTVFGEGPTDADWMLVGEVPGDREDRLGRPFVGPSGRLLDRCLEEVGLRREEGYLTNAVKHFKYKKLGTKRRLHDRPRPAEIRACRPWLVHEITLVRPRVLVCLGAIAARTLLGSAFRVTRQRGVLIPSPWAPHVFATVHPSAVLRIGDRAERQAERERFVADMGRITELLVAH